MKHNVTLEVNKPHPFVVPYIDGEYLPFCMNIEPYNDSETGEEAVKFEASEEALRAYKDDCDCDLSSYVRIATIILKDELLKNRELYNGFISSIESSLKEQKVTALPFQPESDIADKILQRIIGEDEPDERKD